MDTHRRAWKPVELPFTDGSGDGIDPDAESRFDADGYATMQTAAVYRRELDLVIEAPDGSLAGTCTAWLDPASGWAEPRAARHRARAPPPGPRADARARRLPTGRRAGRARRVHQRLPAPLLPRAVGRVRRRGLRADGPRHADAPARLTPRPTLSA
ncbi:hypothetical protein [Clavibacter tessellarius]|uniref:hypothetical protein n=1 Tax=Clavibacter tessellarius TaxID=31965 RepID=UPI003248D49B